MPRRAPTLTELTRTKSPQARPVDQRKTAAARGYDYRWQRFRAAFLGAHPLCKCGKIAEHADHIIPLGEGGAHCDPDNTQPLCQACHNRKTGEEKRRRRMTPGS